MARTADGGLRVGPGPGRGAWLHADAACLDLAVRRTAFARALRAPVADAAIADLRVALGL